MRRSKEMRDTSTRCWMDRTCRLLLVAILSILLGAPATGEAGAWMGTTTRVPSNSLGFQTNGGSGLPSISPDGRYVAYESAATNLVSGDTNGFGDVFVTDRLTGSTTRVSVDNTGNEGNQGGGGPSISADGRYVAFTSDSTNLVEEDTNYSSDIFVHDRQTGLTTRVSVDDAGNQGDGASMTTGGSSISADGRYIAFYSLATNLVAGDTNGAMDVFVHDRQTGRPPV
jgi:Tol biopolymer transport system component